MWIEVFVEEIKSLLKDVILLTLNNRVLKTFTQTYYQCINTCLSEVR